jgi:nucleotide-binding universal stress UspA family protein
MKPQALLAATDFSAHARHAADRAARLARQTGAELSLLHAPPVGALSELSAWLGQDMAQQMRQNAGRQLQSLAAQLAAQLAGDLAGELAGDLANERPLVVHALLAQGDVLDAVQHHAEALDAGLVVVGARGSGFLRRLLLGTTAERLLRRTQRPLLLVRTLPHERYRRALLAVDFSPFSAAVLTLARQFAPDARWVLFHAFQVPFEDKLRFAGVDDSMIERYRVQARALATQRLHELAHAAGLQPGAWDACIAEGDASLRLVEQEQALDCDLVVIGKHGQSMLEDLLLGSVTKHLLAEGAGDVLVATRA